MVEIFCKRPKGLTEVRRDGKDNDAIIKVIKEEFRQCEEKGLQFEEICNHMEIFASGCWVSIFNPIYIEVYNVQSKLIDCYNSKRNIFYCFVAFNGFTSSTIFVG